MSLANFLEVAIGLVLAYYVLGLLVSFISKTIMETFETRGKVLEDYLLKIVGQAKLKDLLARPQIKSLAPVRYNRWYGLLKKGKPDVKGGYFDEAVTKVEKIPVANLVEAFFEAAEMTGQTFTAQELKDLVDQLPEATRNVLKPLLDKGVTRIEDYRKALTTWFTGLMDQAADTFKAYARRYVILLAVVVTLVFGIDSIELYTKLNQDANFRAIANAQAQALVQKGEDVKLEDVLQDAEKLSLRVGWLALPQTLPARGAAPGEIASYWALKVLGLTITAAAVSQGSSFWYDILKKLTNTGASKSEEEEGSA